MLVENREISELNKQIIELERWKKRKDSSFREKKHRKDLDVVDIDGKRLRWGDFKKKFKEDINKNRKMTMKDFVMYKGDPEKEKLLHWTMANGFLSDDSDD
jgi:hypothetical protein